MKGVRITTKSGSVYELYRAEGKFSKVDPATEEVLDTGPVLNKEFPMPKAGEPLEIWTTHPTKPFRVIITAPMVRGAVIQ